jgi:hypothetical protein
MHYSIEKERKYREYNHHDSPYDLVILESDDNHPNPCNCKQQ